jgi:hypothetical protein
MVMAEIIIQRNGVLSLGSIDGEKDLEPKPGFNINTSPADGRCDCCGRSLDELKPFFGKAGDPLVGDFPGALLIKTFRAMALPDEEVNRIMDRFLGENFTSSLNESVVLHQRTGNRGNNVPR